MLALHYKSWMASLLALALVGGVALTTEAQDQSQGQNQGQSQDQGQQNQGQQGQQNQSGGAPIPAYRSPLASAADNGDQDEGTAPTPDTRALSGVQDFSVGLVITRSYWEPYFDVFGTADSNALEQANGSSWGTWTSVSGGVDIRRVSGESDLTLSYLGGGMFSNVSGAGNGIVQGLGFADRFDLRRWKLTFLDQLSYLPESAFGYGGLGGTSLPGIGTSGAGSVFTPGQTILTGQGQNIENSVNGEADFLLSARSSVTFAGGDSLLHFFNSDLLNSQSVIGRFGYNYDVTRKDTIAGIYTYDVFTYGNSSQSITEHTIQGSYGRRVTGRFAFRIAAGPQIATFHIPITTTGSGTPAPNSTELLWSLDAAASYDMRRLELTVAYDHGVTAGSGVLAGSQADTVTGSALRKMSRTFTSGITTGYSRNRGLVIGAVPTSQLYNYWFVGAHLSHPWGPDLGLTLSYQLEYQDSNSTFCVGTSTSCGTSVIRHLISVGVGWHRRPIQF